MLFMNISRKFGAVYQEEQAADGGTPAAAPAVEVEAKSEEAVKPARIDVPEVAKPAVEVEVKAEVPAVAGDVKTQMGEFVTEYAEGKPALKLALNWLGDAGIGPKSEAFLLAEQSGDFSLLKAELAAKGLPGTSEMLGILEGAVADTQAANDAAEEKTTQLVAAVLGDEQEAVFTWARENAEPEEISAVNEMLAAGGFYAHMAALGLKALYAGTSPTKAAANPLQNVTPVGGANAALSAADYSSAVEALARKVKGDPRGTAEYQQLQSRRLAGQRRGI